MFVSKKRFEGLEKLIAATHNELRGKISTLEMQSLSRQSEIVNLSRSLRSVGDVIDELKEGNLIDKENDYLGNGKRKYPIVARFKALLDHLKLEYQEKTETTSGYVKRGKK